MLRPPPKPSSSRKCRRPYPCGACGRVGGEAGVLALNLVNLRSTSGKGQSYSGTRSLGDGEGPGHRRVSLTRVQSGWPSATEVEAEVGRLQKACSLLRLRMEEELMAG